MRGGMRGRCGGIGLRDDIHAAALTTPRAAQTCPRPRKIHARSHHTSRKLASLFGKSDANLQAELPRMRGIWAAELVACFGVRLIRARRVGAVCGAPTTPPAIISPPQPKITRIKHSAAPFFSARLSGGKLTFVYATMLRRGQMSIFRVDMEVGQQDVQCTKDNVQIGIARHAARGGPVWRVSANWLLISRRLADGSVCSFGVCFYSYGDWMGQARRLGKTALLRNCQALQERWNHNALKKTPGGAAWRVSANWLQISRRLAGGGLGRLYQFLPISCNLCSKLATEQ